MANSFTNSEITLESLPRFEDVEYNPVSKHLLYKELLLVSIPLLVVILGGGVYFYFNPLELFSALLTIALLLFFGLRYIDVILRQKYYGFALREKDILYRRGYIITKATVIPFNRIQHSSVSRTLFDKIFGIATLRIYTAGGSSSDMNIPGLSPDLAKNLNQTVSQKIAKHEH